MTDVPRIYKGYFNKSGHTQDHLLSDFELTFIEFAYTCCRNGKKIYYFRFGRFTTSQLTIQDKLKHYGNNFHLGVTGSKRHLHLHQHRLMLLFPYYHLQHQSETTIAAMDHATSTSSSIHDEFKMLHQVHFFNQGMALKIHSNSLWDMIDCDELSDSLVPLIKAVQTYNIQEWKNHLSLIGESEEESQLIGGSI